MKLIYLIVFFITVIKLSANDLIISYSQGFAGTSHADLKEFNVYFHDFYKRTNNLELKIVDNYPDYYYIEAGIKYKNSNDIIIGLGYKTFSSGARINYSDFSGEVRSDFLSNSDVIYFLGQYDYRIFNYFSIAPFLNYDLIFSSLAIKDYIRIYEDSQNTTTKFSAFSHSITFGSDFMFLLNPIQIGIKMSYGYDLNDFFFRGAYDHEDNNFTLTGNKAILAKWGGYRIGLIISYVI